MVKIIVNEKEAVAKAGFTFEYIVENRLFMGRDGYTLTIAFPLDDCAENRAIFGHINRADVAGKNVTFDCRILTARTSLAGVLSVVKVSQSEIECQFAAGKCEQTLTSPFEDVKINTLELGAPPTLVPQEIKPADAWPPVFKGSAVALPWINSDYPTVPNNWVVFNQDTGTWEWEPGVEKLSWQPYLIEIAKRICKEIGYVCDFSEWEDSAYARLIVCNTLPASWDMPDYAYALPDWTIVEFFEQLELLMLAEFDFDHREQSVKMTFSQRVVSSIKEVRLEQVTDEYSADIAADDDDSTCEYIASKTLKYKDGQHEMQNYYSCDWFVQNRPVVWRYATLDALIEKNKLKSYERQTTLGHDHDVTVTRYCYGEIEEFGRGVRFLNWGALLYAEDVDTYFVIRRVGISDDGKEICVLQPVNVFGCGSDDDSLQYEEIGIVPVCVTDTYVDASDNRGYMMMLSPGNLDNDKEPEAGLRSADIIFNGKHESSSTFYDSIYVAFWDGTVYDDDAVYPIVDSVAVSQGWKRISLPAGMNLRLTGEKSGSMAKLPRIDSRTKYYFSWLADDIPNPRAIFHIKGRRYLCEKITATFTEAGMSQLLKGEFYPLLDM